MSFAAVNYLPFLELPLSKNIYEECSESNIQILIPNSVMKVVISSGESNFHWSSAVCDGPMRALLTCFLSLKHNGRIKTEAKAKVVASVWGTECIQRLAAPAILYQYEFEE